MQTKAVSNKKWIVPNLKPFYVKQIYTRGHKAPSDDSCECKLCQIASASLIQVDSKNNSVILNRRKDHRRRPRRPHRLKRILFKLIHVKQNNLLHLGFNRKPKIIQVFKTCYYVIRRGTSHKRTTSTRIKNLAEIVQRSIAKRSSDLY